MKQENQVQHVFLVGAKSLGAYGGYETFVYKLTEYHQNNPHIRYHVACKANGDGCMDETKVEGVTRISDREFEFHNARCFKIHIPQIGRHRLSTTTWPPSGNAAAISASTGFRIPSSTSWPAASVLCKALL